MLGEGLGEMMAWVEKAAGERRVGERLGAGRLPGSSSTLL